MVQLTIAIAQQVHRELQRQPRLADAARPAQRASHDAACRTRPRQGIHASPRACPNDVAQARLLRLPSAASAKALVDGLHRGIRQRIGASDASSTDTALRIGCAISRKASMDGLVIAERTRTRSRPCRWRAPSCDGARQKGRSRISVRSGVVGRRTILSSVSISSRAGRGRRPPGRRAWNLRTGRTCTQRRRPAPGGSACRDDRAAPHRTASVSAMGSQLVQLPARRARGSGGAAPRRRGVPPGSRVRTSLHAARRQARLRARPPAWICRRPRLPPA